MNQLEGIFSHLRSVERPPNTPLGGVEGEGCKDLRRNVRRSKGRIDSVEQYDEFLFSNVRYGSPKYLDFLRGFQLKTSNQVCFSHGDVRPDNIIVQRGQDGKYDVSGIVDWEFSGFYPGHYECSKVTTCLSTDETSDWYERLPPSLSPFAWPVRWLLDYVLGGLLE